MTENHKNGLSISNTEVTENQSDKQEFETVLKTYVKDDQPDKTLPPDDSEKQNPDDDNPFPIHAFPKAIQEIIVQAERCWNFPPDYLGSGMLSAVAVSIGNSLALKVKGDYVERAVLYMALVGRPGCNKSHPLKFAFRRIRLRDKQLIEKYKQAKAQWEAEGSEGPEPRLHKIIVSDFTPEALAMIHSNNLRGVGVLIDELTGWIKNFNRYSSGSAQEFFLSSWSGEPISIDRKTGEPVYIDLPNINVVGTIQPGVLNELVKNGGKGNGFIDRIVFAYPDSSEKPYWSEIDMDPLLTDRWNNCIDKVLDIPLTIDEHGRFEPRLLQFSPEGKKLLIKWQRSNTDDCNHAVSDSLKGVYSKMDVYVIRLALIMHAMRWSCREGELNNVGAIDVQSAIDLVKYFKACAVKVQGQILDLNPIDKLSRKMRSLFDALPNEFETAIGLQMAASMGVPERTFKRFLQNESIFIKMSHGNYKRKLGTSGTTGVK